MADLRVQRCNRGKLSPRARLRPVARIAAFPTIDRTARGRSAVFVPRSHRRFDPLPVETGENMTEGGPVSRLARPSARNAGCLKTVKLL